MLSLRPMLKEQAIRTLKLSIPIILGELTQMSLGIINSAMLGRLGYKQLAASALVNSVMVIPYVFGIGLTMSISQTVAIANGQSDKQKVSHYLYNGFILMCLAAFIIGLTLHVCNPILFHLKQDSEVAALAAPYLKLMSYSVIPMLLFFALKQFTDGLESTKTAMTLSMLSMPINILLDWGLIFGHLGLPRLGLIGAGYATLITRTVVFITMALVILLHPEYKKYIAVRKNQWQIKMQTIRELLRIGIPSSLQALLEVGAFAVSGILIGRLGAVALAAHQITLQIASFTFMVSLGLAQGSSIRIGNALGKNEWSLIKVIGKSTFLTGLIYGISCAVIFIVFRGKLPYIFNDNINVVTLTTSLLFFAAIFQISDATQAIAVGALRGIKDVKIPTLMMTFSYWIIGIPLGIFLAFYTSLGVYGIWIGFVIGLSSTSLLLNIRFNKKVNRMIKTVS